MKAKKNAPTGAGTPDQGATKGLSVRTEDTTSDKIQQVLRLFAELSRYAVIKTAALLLLLLAPVAVKAEAEPEIILIGVVAPAETPAIRYEYQPVTHYDWTDKEIDEVAKILWAETGKGCTYSEKEAICCLILNRVHHGDPFPEDVVSVCKQKGEFNRGRVSDANRQIARECLDRYQSHLDGNWQDINFPQDAVYMARNGQTLVFYNSDWQKVYEVK